MVKKEDGSGNEMPIFSVKALNAFVQHLIYHTHFCLSSSSSSSRRVFFFFFWAGREEEEKSGSGKDGTQPLLEIQRAKSKRERGWLLCCGREIERENEVKGRETG